MEKYWENRPRSSPITNPTPTNNNDITPTSASTGIMSEFDRYRRTLVATEEDGWQSELRRYLKDVPPDVTAETDVIRYWQVCHFISFYYLVCLTSPLHTEQSQTLSHPWTYRTRHPPDPCIFGSLRASFFCRQGNCR